MTRDVQPPDLVMQVRAQNEHGRTRLVYTLDSPTGAVAFSHHVVTGPVFHGSPDEFHRHFLRKIEQLGDRLDVDGSCLLPGELDRKLVSLGQDLWRELIPTELRHAYREIRRSVHSWMIISDEPWIPWELIKPYDASRPDDVVDDDFLALRFELTRWLAGEHTPAREIKVRSLAALRTATDLPQIEEEMSLLEDLVRSSPGAVCEAPALDSASELLSYLQTSDVQLLHFMGHGTHEASQADESGIPLPDGSVLRPRDLEGPVAAQLRRTQALVFLNTCWAGQQGWSLTGLGGWAFRWVGVCGCSAFVAPMWPVRDQIALSFARIFYGALAGGAPLGEAAREARRLIQQERSGDPSVLAYAVYGHPHARVRFGELASNEDISARGEMFKRRKPIDWTPRRRQRRSQWLGAATACGVAMGLHLAATPLLDLLFPFDQPPQQAAMVLNRPRPVSESTSSRKAGPATSTTVGGLRFEITGGTASVNYALKQAFNRAARTVSEEGVSGWTITVRLDRPEIETHTRDGFDMKACRLMGEAAAKGNGSRIDLGPSEVVNSQFDGAQACEAAAGSIADAVVSRFVAAIGTKGES